MSRAQTLPAPTLSDRLIWCAQAIVYVLALELSQLFCGCHPATPLYDIIMHYVRHFRKPGDPSRRAGLTTTYFVEDACRGINVGGSLDKAWADMTGGQDK